MKILDLQPVIFEDSPRFLVDIIIRNGFVLYDKVPSPLRSGRQSPRMEPCHRYRVRSLSIAAHHLLFDKVLSTPHSSRLIVERNDRPVSGTLIYHRFQHATHIYTSDGYCISFTTSFASLKLCERLRIFLYTDQPKWLRVDSP
ncbi:hypothetical protein EVAR_6985_1 [Eumeta japonica]|uniref:Uncharacterized protein n=1 Tax=Eumeta variegata TaxID=151549 RepID=A0A4C1TJR4_EUMVA|nr:hypothetical protein EVAR_6985_1 [Eumeta japonica]